MIAINGREIETDAEGYLANLEDWSEDVAEYLSKQDDLQLTEKHWQLLLPGSAIVSASLSASSTP